MTASCSRWIAVCVDMLNHTALDAGPYDRRSAWLWLIANAAWKDKRVNHKGKPLDLQRGQVLVGRSFLAEQWGWSEQNVRTFMALLVSEGMIEVSNQSNGHFANVASICNYDEYQNAADRGKPVIQPVPNQCLTRAQPEPNQTLTKTTNITKDKTPLTPLRGDADDLTVSADPYFSEGVLQDASGRITLVNGTQQMWLSKFGGDAEALELALIQAAGERQRNSRQPLRLQTERVLARIAGSRRDSDRRYQAAVKSNNPIAAKTGESQQDRFARYAREMESKHAAE